MADLLVALPEAKCEDISSSCAVMNFKKPLHPLLDGSGFFLNMGSSTKLVWIWHNRLGRSVLILPCLDTAGKKVIMGRDFLLVSCTCLQNSNMGKKFQFFHM